MTQYIRNVEAEITNREKASDWYKELATFIPAEHKRTPALVAEYLNSILEIAPVPLLSLKSSFALKIRLPKHASTPSMLTQKDVSDWQQGARLPEEPTREHLYSALNIKGDALTRIKTLAEAALEETAAVPKDDKNFLGVVKKWAEKHEWTIPASFTNAGNIHKLPGRKLFDQATATIRKAHPAAYQELEDTLIEYRLILSKTAKDPSLILSEMPTRYWQELLDKTNGAKPDKSTPAWVSDIEPIASKGDYLYAVRKFLNCTPNELMHNVKDSANNSKTVKKTRPILNSSGVSINDLAIAESSNALFPTMLRFITNNLFQREELSGLVNVDVFMSLTGNKRVTFAERFQTVASASSERG